MRALTLRRCRSPRFAGCAGQEKRDAPIVNDLKIRGTRAKSESAIKKRILTTETGWWPFATEHYFDPVEWQTDLARIERFYHARGYYQAKVLNSEVELIPPKHPGQDRQGQPDGRGAGERAGAGGHHRYLGAGGADRGRASKR